MFSDIITELASAFQQVVNLVSGVLGNGFDAVADLSSGVFGGEEAGEETAQ